MVLNCGMCRKIQCFGLIQKKWYGILSDIDNNYVGIKNQK